MRISSTDKDKDKEDKDKDKDKNKDKDKDKDKKNDEDMDNYDDISIFQGTQTNTSSFINKKIVRNKNNQTNFKTSSAVLTFIGYKQTDRQTS